MAAPICRAFLPLTLSFLLTLSAVDAQAYTFSRTLNGSAVRWKRQPTYVVFRRAAPGITLAQTVAAIDRAHRAWNDVSCSSLSYSDGGETPTAGSSRDGVTTHTVLTSWPAAYGEAVGITFFQYDSTGAVQDADVHYNPNTAWSDGAVGGRVDFESVASHEIGHALGLDHTRFGNAVMLAAVRTGQPRRSLSSDDVAGLCALYPKSTSQPECQRDTDCSGGKTCQSGRCIQPPSPPTRKGYRASCSRSTECQSGICLSIKSKATCTQACGAARCPAGDQCASAPNLPIKNVCIPFSAGAKKTVGERCATAADCRTNSCVAFGANRVCTRTCQTQEQCPGFMHCGGGRCVPGAKPPTTSSGVDGKGVGASSGGADSASASLAMTKTMGDPCVRHADCVTGRCGIDDACVVKCDVDGDCPDGYGCQLADDQQGECLRTLDLSDPEHNADSSGESSSDGTSAASSSGQSDRGCALGGGSRTSWGLLLLAAFFALRRRAR